MDSLWGYAIAGYAVTGVVLLGYVGSLVRRARVARQRAAAISAKADPRPP